MHPARARQPRALAPSSNRSAPGTRAPAKALPWAGPRLGTVWTGVPAGVLLLFLAIPLFGLIVRAASSGTLVEALGHAAVWEALRLSLQTTAVVLLITVLLGSPLALLLARRRLPGVSLLEALVDLPIVLPPAAAGLALLVTFGRRGLLGGALTAGGIELPFTTLAVVLAALFVAAPFYVRAARSGFLSVPREAEEAALIEGASEWQVFRHITLPLAAPALMGGAVLCAARALGEFGATVMFAGNFPGRTQTMPLAIYAALERDLDAAVALALILLAVSFALLLLLHSRQLRPDDSMA